MPERLLYDEAMLLCNARMKVQDPQIKQGKVDMLLIETNRGPIERPWGVEGGFAVVYKFRTRNGQHKALRCFRVPISPDMQARYEQIEDHFQAHAPSITVNFKYHAEGIVVKEAGPGGRIVNKVYPIIEMDWVEGVTLLTRVDELCKNRQRQALKDLSAQWLDLFKQMRDAQIAHGDLAGLNVMLRGDGSLALIDYDGVYIPAFANMPQLIAGQIDYQHPQMAQRKFDLYMDDFSALVIYLALLVVSLRPDLWIKYVKRPEGKLLDVNFLFAQQDFKEPDTSALLREIEQINDPQIKALAQELKRQCRIPIEEVRFPFKQIDPVYHQQQQLQELEKALADNDDERTLSYWRSGLDTLPQARRYQKRIQQIQQQQEALTRFRTALQAQHMQRIVDGYDTILNQSQQLTRQERETLSLARRFVQALKNDQVEELVNVALTIQVHKLPLRLTSTEQQRVTQARQQLSALRRLREALQDGSCEYIAATYSLVKQALKDLALPELQRAELAYNFIQAYQSQQEEAFLQAYAAISEAGLQQAFKFLPAHRQQIKQAQQKVQHLANFKQDYERSYRHAQALVTAYEQFADTMSDALSDEQRARVKLAQAFLQMLHAIRAALVDHNVLIIRQSYNEQLAGEFDDFTSEERAQLMQALTVSGEVNEETVIVEREQEIQPVLIHTSGVLSVPVQAELVEIITQDQPRDSIEITTPLQQQDTADQQKKSLLRLLVESGEYERALLLAKEQVRVTRQPFQADDQFYLSRASRRFIQQQDLTSLQIKLTLNRATGNYSAVAYWRWPSSLLVIDGLLVWRSDSWPQRPQRAEPWRDPNWHAIQLLRRGEQSDGRQEFELGRSWHIYACIYACLRDDWNWNSREKIWYYSSGYEPTSRFEAGDGHMPWQAFR